jgi:hypothetical protein
MLSFSLGRSLLLFQPATMAAELQFICCLHSSIPASSPFFQWDMPPARTSPLQRRERHASSPPELPPFPSLFLSEIPRVSMGVGESVKPDQAKRLATRLRRLIAASHWWASESRDSLRESSRLCGSATPGRLGDYTATQKSWSQHKIRHLWHFLRGWQRTIVVFIKKKNNIYCNWLILLILKLKNTS